MKKIYTKSLFATMMLLISSVGFAQTTFYIEPFSITAGETKEIPVLMENPDETFSQLQFDITLPEGLEIPESYDEDMFDYIKEIKHGSRTSQKAYSIQTQSVDEALRVLCITQNANAYFTGVSGDVLLITVKAADDIAVGDVDIKITNTVLSRQDGSTYKPADCTATVSVGIAQTTFYIEPFSIAAGETKDIPVLMKNPGEKFSQLQFDITLPEGLEIPESYDEDMFDYIKEIKHGSRTSQKAYSIQTQSVDEALRVLCITQNANAYFTGVSGDVLLITVNAADEMAIGDVEIKITNTVLSRQDGSTYKPADCTATVSVTNGSTTGIDEMKGENGEMKAIYDLQGRKVEVPSEGLYIIDNKKVVIK